MSGLVGGWVSGIARWVVSSHVIILIEYIVYIAQIAYVAFIAYNSYIVCIVCSCKLWSEANSH